MSASSATNCSKVSILFVFMLFFQISNAQYNFSALDKLMETHQKEFNGNLIGIIYQNGKIIHQKLIGKDFNLKTQIPIASCSKWLTAALVMNFVDQGKLSLDDKVSKYIPLFAKYSKGYITIKDCLAHLTGIESDGNLLIQLLNRNKFSSLEEEVHDFITKKEIQANPGLEFRYSNIGLNIAARVLELISKRGFDQIMQEYITRPLQMRATSFASLQAVNPSGGAISSAADYINFLSMILNHGTFNGKRILSEKSIEEMRLMRTTPTMIKYAPKVALGYQYGLGTWILEADENGMGTVLASPGLFGSWPMIDLKKEYAVLFFTKSILREDKKEIYLDFKKAIDAQLSK